MSEHQVDKDVIRRAAVGADRSAFLGAGDVLGLWLIVRCAIREPPDDICSRERHADAADPAEDAGDRQENKRRSAEKEHEHSFCHISARPLIRKGANNV